MLALMAATVGARAGGESPGRLDVTVGDNFYQPNVIRVRPEAEIRFTNAGRQLHAMTLIGHERDLDEAYVRPGQTQTFRVRLAAGEYVLGCTIHLDMKARVIVDSQ
jgi:plastocyanin